jgi:hypothetical protein
MTDTRKMLREAELALYLEANDFLGQTGCTSFIQLALMNPELWTRLRQIPALRLQIAVHQGWPLRKVDTTRQQESIYAAIDVVLNQGCDDPYLLWLHLPSQCEALHQAGWLERLLMMVGIEVLSPASIGPNGFNPGLCNIIPEVQELLDSHPAEGWPTRGGSVFRISELILARYLEHYDIAFELVSNASGWRQFVSMSGLTIGFASDPSFHATPPGIKDRLLILDDALLGMPGDIFAFTYHLRVSLAAAGIVTKQKVLLCSDLLVQHPQTGA